MSHTQEIMHPVQDPPRRRRRPGKWLTATIIVLCSGALFAAWCVHDALSTPGDDGAAVKLAEWGRDHHLGPIVTGLESIQYKLSPPAVGGAPDMALLAAAASQTPTPNPADSPQAPPSGSSGSGSPSASPSSNSTGPTVVIHEPMTPPVAPALAGEGVFVAAGDTAQGPLLQTTFVRPDSVHTSFLTGVAWLSHTLRFELHPGFQDPGPSSSWTQPFRVAPSSYPQLMATFNSGFKIKDAGGAYYDHGHLVGTLAAGAATAVIYKDGHLDVGAWGADLKMTKDVAYVRQNLKPLISAGKLAPNLDSNVESNWGATLGGAYSVWRSGLGVTKEGDIVYVMGDAMSVADLADILQRAGAVNAMQLDINRAWVSFMSYQASGTGASVTAHKLGEFERPANRYLENTSRDFFVVLRPGR